MNMERSSATTSPKAVAAPESNGVKGKTKSIGEAGAATVGGFLALLMSLETEGVIGEQGAGAGVFPADPLPAADTQLPTAEDPRAVALSAPDPSVLLAPNLPSALALLLAQAGEVAADKAGTFSDERPGAVTGRVRLAAPAIGSDKLELPLAASAAPGFDGATDLKPGADGLLDQIAPSLPVRARQGAPSSAFQSGAGGNPTESRTLGASSLMNVSARDPVLSGALLSGTGGDGFLRQTDRVAGKSSAQPSGYGAEGLGGPHALLGGSSVDLSPTLADPSMPSLESMVADKVSYWVAQGLQTAQLKLDGLGSEPVEVSISLKGDQAHIGFRTDQPEIRQILEGAAAHLKHLLTGEGLVLAGVSVGASGQDGKGAQEQRSRPGTRQVNVVTTDVAPTESQQRVLPSVGRAVDLFV